MPRKLAVCILLFWSLIPLAHSQEESILDQKISIRFRGVSLPTALKMLNRDAGVNFTYNSNIIQRTELFSSYFKVPLRDILNDLLELENLYYKEVNSNIVILKRPPTEVSIIGRVTDAQEGFALQYANAFMGNTSLGVPTDANGYFRIDNVPNIRSELVVSFVGYRPSRISFPFEDEQDTLDIRLIPQVTVLDPIDVPAPKLAKRFRKRLLKRFTTDFLGRSENAKNARILNPYVLDLYFLDDSTSNYRAVADDALVIENKATGYRVSYRMEEFKFENGLVTKKGQARFTELEPKSRRQSRKWDSARSKAYKGSEMHFLRSLLDDQLFEEGFRLNILRYDSTNFEYSSPLNPPDISEIFTVTPTDNIFQYRLDINFDFEVTYQNEFEDVDYVKQFRTQSKGKKIRYIDRKSRTSISLGNKRILTSHVSGIDPTSVPLFQKSVIAFKKRSLVISYPGYFNDPNGVDYFGWWTWGGFSDVLPINYRPPR